LAVADSEGRATFADVLRIGEFRVLYLTQAQSVIGDQIARIAVAVLVFNRTRSALLTGLSYAVSYLPWLLGGPTLSVYADRIAHKTVMVACDAVRSALVCAIAIPALPVGVLIALVAAVAVLQPPFTSARAALIPDVVGEGDRYTAASTLGNTTIQLGVVIGFAFGGIATAAIGGRPTVLLDAATFGISAVATARYVTWRAPVNISPSSWFAEIREGAAVLGDRRLRWLVFASWIVVGTVITTEAIAVPYAHSHGGGATAAGLLTASLPVGIAVGALVLGRLMRPSAAEALLPGLAVATPVVLGLTWFDPPPLLTGALWFIAGALSAMTVVANRVFVVAVRREVRARAFGIAAAGISGAQGLGTLLVGAIASRTTPAHAVALVSALAVAFLLAITRPDMHRVNPDSGGSNGGSRSPELPSTSRRLRRTTPSRDLPAS
jgi:MFS family permease